MSEWISIKDSVPDSIRIYSVLLDGDTPHSATWHPGKGCFVDMNFLIELHSVTHWRLTDD